MCQKLNPLLLVCEDCKSDYIKPGEYIDYRDSGRTGTKMYYDMNLKYCDDCRRVRENKYLKHLPGVLKALGRAEHKQENSNMSAYKLFIHFRKSIGVLISYENELFTLDLPFLRIIYCGSDHANGSSIFGKEID